MIDTDKLNAAFKNLRKQGFIARQSFSCCSSCAGYKIATDVKEMKEAKRAKVKGWVFYTRQDVARPRERWSYRGGTQRLFLAYGPVSVHEVGDFGLPTVEVGQAIKAALEEQGLKVEWDGDPNKRIEVVS